MTRNIEKRFARNVLAVSIAAIGMNAGMNAAWADEGEEEVRRLIRPDSEIELGVGHLSSDGNNKFGDFTGLDHTGTNLIGNVRVTRRGENDPGYLEIDARNLGLDSRSIKVEGGQQGNFGLRFEYDQLPKLFSDSYQTPFVNPGDNRLVLPAGWVASNTTPGMARLNSSMRSFDVETMRKSIGLGLTKLLPAGWDVSVNFKREKKDGNRFIGAVIGNSGGNPRAAILPEPVDYTTDQFEAIARYTTPKLQLQFGYYGSFFRNDNAALAWQNPYANAAGTTWGNAAVGYAGGGFGQIGLPPDNQFHQIHASGGYNYSKDTRIAGNLSFGRMTQDDTFLPYSVNPALAIGTPMPRSSLNGKINTTHADLKLTSKLMPKLHFTAAYRYDDRDNNTPQAQYWYIGGDSQTQAAAGTSKVRTNLPGSSTKQQAHAELDYKLAAHTKLKLGYEYDWVKKTYEAIDWEREHTVKAGVDHRFNEMASAGVSYAYSDRNTSNYNAGSPFLASYTSAAYIATLPVNQRWDNVPTQKKFFLAPRKRDKLRAHANVSPNERLDLQFGVDYNDDNYHDSELGLRHAKGWAANIDANLQATDAVTGHAFASFENYGSDQRSVQLAADRTQYTDPARRWTADISDQTLTVGLGFRVKPGGRYEFGGDFSHSHSNGEIKVTTSGTAAVPAAMPLPDVTSRLNRVDLFGRYWVKKDVSVNVKYIYERFRSKDWAYDNVLTNSMANVIGTNQESPDYRVHFIGVSASYRFQ
ncbi:MAG: MtrB/PioB family decaheme-associated outer membrane protein [Denitratisoma sp.]|nr:MtrB/PioB family decaheme-associated outer membrane protein [Denitratisoma sp.]